MNQTTYSEENCREHAAGILKLGECVVFSRDRTDRREDGPLRLGGSGVEGGVSTRMRRGFVTVGGVAGIVFFEADQRRVTYMRDFEKGSASCEAGMDGCTT